MIDGKMTNEQFRAVERWENEDGKVSRSVVVFPGSQREINRTEEPRSRGKFGCNDLVGDNQVCLT
jgi:hypothetical protein